MNLSIYRDTLDNIATKLYRKSMAGYTLLHANSGYPISLVHSIPYVQYIRLRRNCTHEAEFRSQADELRIHLRKHGYSKSLLRRAFNKAIGRDRTFLLYSKPKSDQMQTNYQFITRYSAQHRLLRTCMEKHWHLLSENSTLANTSEIPQK